MSCDEKRQLEKDVRGRHTSTRRTSHGRRGVLDLLDRRGRKSEVCIVTEAILMRDALTDDADHSFIVKEPGRER
jgi:hypothetical protein